MTDGKRSMHSAWLPMVVTRTWIANADSCADQLPA